MENAYNPSVNPVRRRGLVLVILFLYLLLVSLPFFLPSAHFLALSKS